MSIKPVLPPSRSLPLKRTFNTLRYAVPLAIGVLGLMLINPVNPALAQERTMRTVTVTGQGVEMIPTTLSQIQLGVEVQGRTAQDVQQEAARRTSAVVELLRSRNVDELETAGINLSPRYDYNDGDQRLVGYVATNTVSFEVPTEQAGAILDAAVNAGATRIDGISFTAEDEAITVAQRQALREATQDAREQADAVLDALGLTPGQVMSIQINGASAPTPPPMPLLREAALQSADVSTPVVGGEQRVQAAVTLEISY